MPIRASCAIAGIDSVIIIGSQAILGSFDEDVLPPEATMSREVDVLPDVVDPALASELADRIEGVGGELVHLRGAPRLRTRRCGLHHGDPA